MAGGGEYLIALWYIITNITVMKYVTTILGILAILLSLLAIANPNSDVFNTGLCLSSGIILLVLGLLSWEKDKQQKSERMAELERQSGKKIKEFRSWSEIKHTFWKKKRRFLSASIALLIVAYVFVASNPASWKNQDAGEWLFLIGLVVGLYLVALIRSIFIGWKVWICEKGIIFWLFGGQVFYSWDEIEGYQDNEKYVSLYSKPAKGQKKWRAKEMHGDFGERHKEFIGMLDARIPEKKIDPENE